VWDAITTFYGAIIETLESIFGWIYSALAFVIELIFSIPYVGRLLKWIWNIVLTALAAVSGLADAVLGTIGIRPEKKLRVCTIILNSDGGLSPSEVSIAVANYVAALQNTVKIYREEANIRVIDEGPFHYSSGFASDEKPDSGWVQVYSGQNPAGPADTQCDVPMASEDLGPDGSSFEFIASTQCFYGDGRRVIGYGAPVIVFGVRGISGGHNGCSFGPLADYVTVLRTDPGSMPHEIAHACNLIHNSGATNLMNPNVDHVTTGIHLEWWQVIALRSFSRHVTYF
jgi:hypothetical protein